MSETFLLFTIAIALSMDAFSMSLSFGTLNISSITNLKLALSVGIMHFIMPLLGVLLGKEIVSFFDLNSNVVLAGILIYLGIQMIIEAKKETQKQIKFSFLGMFLFALGVSIDAFSVGIGLMAITSNILYASLLFSIISFSFTYIGLLIGKYVNHLLGKQATYIGAIFLLLLAIFHLCK